MRKALMAMASCLILSSQLLWGQTPLADLERAWQEDRFEEISRLLPAAEKAHPGHPTVFFFKALVAEEAEYAFEQYKKVIEAREESKYADTALFKMAQYHYARSYFQAARRTWRLLQNRFPNSKWVDDSAYLIAQSYMAEGKKDSAEINWKRLIKTLPGSPYSDLAVADLERTPQAITPAAKPAAVQQSEKKAAPYYAIQVGAFSQPGNAKTILSGLEKVGYSGQIVEKKVGSRTFFAVWIGQFKDRPAAEDYARRFIVKMTREYNIVKSE